MDLIGFLLKGPANLDENKDADALELIRRAKLCVEEWDSIEMSNSDAHQAFFQKWGTEDRYRDDLWYISLSNLPKKAEEEILKEFKDFWKDPFARDTNSRIDPEDPAKQIVFSGAGSWGEEPDGYGYTILKQAELLGLLDVYGIK